MPAVPAVVPESKVFPLRLKLGWTESVMDTADPPRLSVKLVALGSFLSVSSAVCGLCP